MNARKVLLSIAKESKMADVTCKCHKAWGIYDMYSEWEEEDAVFGYVQVQDRQTASFLLQKI